jgi:hypothetical protein
MVRVLQKKVILTIRTRKKTFNETKKAESMQIKIGIPISDDEFSSLNTFDWVQMLIFRYLLFASIIFYEVNIYLILN